jgi:hypothetical protein
LSALAIISIISVIAISVGLLYRRHRKTTSSK